jgi:hypothetical protein
VRVYVARSSNAVIASMRDTEMQEVDRHDPPRANGGAGVGSKEDNRS